MYKILFERLQHQVFMFKDFYKCNENHMYRVISCSEGVVMSRMIVTITEPARHKGDYKLLCLNVHNTSTKTRYKRT